MTLASAPTFLQPAERWSRVVVRLRTGVWDLQEQWGQQSHTQTQQCRQSPRGWCCQPSASPAKGSVSGTATQSYFTAARVCCSHDATLQGQEVSPPSLDAIWTFCAHSALSVHSLPPRGGHSCTSARPCARDSDPQFHVGVQDWGCLLRISFSSSLPDFSPPDLLRMSPVSADGDLGFLSPHPLPKLYLQGQELPSERATAFITSLQAASFLPASSQPNPSHHYSRPYFSATQRRPNARGCWLDLPRGHLWWDELPVQKQRLLPVQWPPLSAELKTDPEVLSIMATDSQFKPPVPSML